MHPFTFIFFGALASALPLSGGISPDAVCCGSRGLTPCPKNSCPSAATAGSSFVDINDMSHYARDNKAASDHYEDGQVHGYDNNVGQYARTNKASSEGCEGGGVYGCGKEGKAYSENYKNGKYYRYDNINNQATKAKIATSNRHYAQDASNNKKQDSKVKIANSKRECALGANMENSIEVTDRARGELNAMKPLRTSERVSNTNNKEYKNIQGAKGTLEIDAKKDNGDQGLWYKASRQLGRDAQTWRYIKSSEASGREASEGIDSKRPGEVADYSDEAVRNNQHGQA